MHRILKIVRPRNVKNRIHPRYDRFVGCTFLSNIAMSAQISMSTHNMLSCISSCNNSYILSSNYIGKDICGQLGSLWYINKTAEKSDKNPQTFLKKSLIIQQSAVTIEFLTPMFPSSAFLLIAGLGNIGQNISASGIGAVNAKVIREIGEDNMGEVYAKLSCLNTLGTSIGMGLGVMVNILIPDENIRFGLIIMLGILRYCLYKYACNNIL